MLLLNPLMLVGLAAAAVPVVLHLLSRARFRQVEWGAMLFLDSGETRHVHRARLHQWLLLLLRMALVAAIAVALARPILPGPAGAGVGAHRLTAVIVLDCSGSMGYDENGHSRFELAQSAARQVLRGLRPGDRAALVLMGAQPPAEVIGPTADLSAVAARIDEQRVGYESADVKQGLLAAADMIERGSRGAVNSRQRDGPDQEPEVGGQGLGIGGDIFVIGDRQALSFRGIDSTFGKAWRQQSAEDRLRCYCIPVGGTEADDVAVVGLSVIGSPIVRGQSVDATVSLTAFGSARAGLSLTLLLDGRAVAERMVNLDESIGSPLADSPRGQTIVPAMRTVPQSFVLSFRAPSAGSHLLSARVSAAGYAANDHYTIPLTVIDPIRAMLIASDAKSSAFGGSAEFIRWGLLPHQATVQRTAASGDLFSLDTISDRAWSATMLDTYQVAILTDIEGFSSAQVRELEQFVYDGGGVLIAPGALSQVQSYNSKLYRGGAGILPAQLKAATAPDGSEATSLLGFDVNSPVFAFLRGRAMPDLSETGVIARYFPCQPRQNRTADGSVEPWRQVDATVLARYLSGQPFLIQGTSGRGRVLLLTTSLDADWTTLPLTNFYLPFVQSAVRYLAGSEPDHSLSAGQPIQLELPASVAADSHVTLIRPDGQRVLLDVFGTGPRRLIRYADTAVPGVYAIRPTGGRPIYFVAHGSIEESNLTQLTPGQWKWVQAEMSAQRIDDSTAPIPQAMARAREGRDLEPYFLGIALLLGMLELVAGKW